jgi:hypothetical protein
MSLVANLEAKLAEVKDKVEGDLHALVLKLEAVFQRVQRAPLEDVVKEAVVADLHTAAEHVSAVADTVRKDADVAVKVVDAADAVVDKTAGK